MPPSSPPVFGKRNAPRQAPARAVPSTSPDHAAAFAAIRAELEETQEPRPCVVPRSFRAAFLAGLVVGCALVGFDVTGEDGARRVASIADLVGVRIDTTPLLPLMILLGLIGGARAAAMTMILVHSLLTKAGRTEHEAYALAGAAASAGLAGALLLCFGHPPTHGWPIELACGAASGLLYRIFAGSRPATG